MGDLSDAAIVAALRRQMTIAVAKQVTASGNLANIDTPGYKARQLEFTAALDRQLAAGMATTDEGHLGGATSSSMQTVEQPGAPERRDGNSVQIDRELLALTRAAGEFSAAQTALTAKFRLIRYALSEGR